MNVYLTAASAKFANHLGQRTSHMLGQPLHFPYFNAFDEALLSLEQLYAYFDVEIDRTLQLAGWDKSELKNIPILLGSTAYVISDCEARLANHLPLPEQHSLAVIADDLRRRYQTEVFSFATSCTSSAQAMGYAYKMLQNGLYEKALVIGFETFNRLTFEHFQAMNLLSQDAQYLPLIQPTGIIKARMGHTLGASGALESAYLFEQFTNNEQKCGYFLNYFLGFGGSNIAWVLKVKQ